MPLQRRGSGRRVVLVPDRAAAPPALDAGEIRAVGDVVVLGDLAGVQLVAVVVDRDDAAELGVIEPAVVALESVLPRELPVRLDDVPPLPCDLQPAEVVAGEIRAAETIGDRLAAALVRATRRPCRSTPRPRRASDPSLSGRSRPASSASSAPCRRGRTTTRGTGRRSARGTHRLVADDGRSPVAADVVERVHGSFLTADDDQAVAGEVKTDVLPAGRDLRVVRDEPPPGPPEPLQLESEARGLHVLVPLEAELRSSETAIWTAMAANLRRASWMAAHPLPAVARTVGCPGRDSNPHARRQPD